MDRKASFITAAAVTATVLAGTTAVAANIGILNSADDGPIGDLSARAEVTATTAPPAPEPQVIDVYLDEPIAPEIASTTVPASVFEEAGAQEFAVEDAGVVTIETTDDGLRVGMVVANPGWEWTSAEDGPIEVTFTDGDTTYVLSAELAEDGSITARVEQPIVTTVVVPAPSAPAAVSPGAAPAATAVPSGEYHDDDDSYEDDDHEDDHTDEPDEPDEQDEQDDDEHEGGDDDD